MAFYPREGNWTYTYKRKSESTVFAPNTLVAEDVDASEIIPATSTSTNIVGICLEEVTPTSSNYATNDRILVAIPADRSAKFYGDITTGTIDITNEGDVIDLTNSEGANAGASVVEVLKIDTYLSPTSALFNLNRPSIT